MPCRRLLPTTLLALVAGSLTTTPAWAGETRAVGDGYSGYVACSTKAGAKPSHKCKVSQSKTAFFMSTKHNATYKVCVKFPNKKRRLCASAQDAPKGKKASVSITSSRTGTHKVSWYVGGEQVATWKFVVVADRHRA